MTSTHTILRIALIASLGSSAPVVASQRVSLLRPGSFHAGEVAAGSGGPWVALVIGSNSASLHLVRASVTPEEDGIVDSPGEKTGTKVEITPEIEPAVLLRGINTLKPGPLRSAVTRAFVEPGAPVAARIGEKLYRFDVRCVDTTPVSGQRQHACSLTLHAERSATTLFTYRGYTQEDAFLWASETPPSIIWAGDIDADGGLDVLLDTSAHYNESRMTLYLSSAAAPGKLLGPVATFSSVGC